MLQALKHRLAQRKSPKRVRFRRRTAVKIRWKSAENLLRRVSLDAVVEIKPSNRMRPAFERCKRLAYQQWSCQHDE
jgi:hypothetical protein